MSDFEYPLFLGYPLVSDEDSFGFLPNLPSAAREFCTLQEAAIANPLDSQAAAEAKKLIEQIKKYSGIGNIDPAGDDCSSITSSAFWDGFHNERWREPDFLAHLPQFFSIEPERLVARSDDTIRAVLREHAGCDCVSSINNLCKTYRGNIRFQICETRNPEDLDYYRSAGITLFRRPTEVPKEELSRMIICVGLSLDASLSMTYPTVYLVLPHEHHTWMSVTDTFNVPKFSIRSLTPSDSSSSILSSRVGGVIGDVDSRENWDLARTYLTRCRQDHDVCRQRDLATSASRFFPTRLVDLGEVSTSGLTIIETAKIRPSERYVTLSYCWGAEQPERTTTANLQRRLADRGLSLHVLPLSIQHAIRVATELSFRFIWIDSLCIVQDDDDDKQREISTMGEVYRHSALLIAASRSTTCNDGFLQNVSDREISLREFAHQIPFRFRGSLSPEDEDGLCVLESWHTDTNVRDPIHHRGWTMQEHSLSRRILAFGQSGMRWQCLSAARYGSSGSGHSSCTDNSERLDRLQKWSVRREATFSGDKRTHSAWNSTRGLLAIRDFTDPRDRLPGLSALAKQYATLWGGGGGRGSLAAAAAAQASSGWRRGAGDGYEYLAGHWRRHLPRDLLWKSKTLMRDRDDHFPTWSWASGSMSATGGEAPQRYRGTDWAMVSFPPPPTGPSSSLGRRRSKQEDGSNSVMCRLLRAEVRPRNPADPFLDVRSARLLLHSACGLVPVDLVAAAGGRWPPENYDVELEMGDDGGGGGGGGGGCSLKVQVDLYYRSMSESRFRGGGSSGATKVGADNWAPPEHFLLPIMRNDSSVGWGNGPEGEVQGLVVRQEKKTQDGEQPEFVRLGTFEYTRERHESSRSYEFRASEVAWMWEGSGEGDYGGVSPVGPKKRLFDGCIEQEFWLV